MSAEAPAYQEFPITLVHPAYQPSKSNPIPGTEIFGANGALIRQDYRGTPERYPPVTARNETEEEYYKAQGYTRAGKVDPSAWARAHASAPPEDYKPIKYPRWRGGKLYMTAQEDPHADEEDLAPPAPAVTEPAKPAVDGEAENLRAMVQQMNETMRAMAEQMAEQKDKANRSAARAAELEAMLDQATQPAAGAAGEVPAGEGEATGDEPSDAEGDEPKRRARKLN